MEVEGFHAGVETRNLNSVKDVKEVQQLLSLQGKDGLTLKANCRTRRFLPHVTGSYEPQIHRFGWSRLVVAHGEVGLPHYATKWRMALLSDSPTNTQRLKDRPRNRLPKRLRLCYDAISPILRTENSTILRSSSSSPRKPRFYSLESSE
jgi:hypothetical protein